MDLGIKERSAIVCASSRGLGEACATSLAREGVRVFINGRNQRTLDEAALRIERATGQRAFTVKADITTEEGRERILSACPNADMLINNNAGPAPGKLEDWDHAAWITALDSNMLAPILLIRAVLPGMRKRRFGRIINITSAMVKSRRPVSRAVDRLSVLPTASATSCSLAFTAVRRMLGLTQQARSSLQKSHTHAATMHMERHERGIHAL